MVMALQSTLPDVPYSYWGKLGSNITTVLKPFFPLMYFKGVTSGCVGNALVGVSFLYDQVYFERLRISISGHENLGRSVKPALQLYFYAACWDDVVDHEMGSSSTIQVGKPGLGSCEFSEILMATKRPVSRLQLLPVINEFHSYPYFCSLSMRWLIFCLLCQFAGTGWLAPLCATEAL